MIMDNGELLKQARQIIENEEIPQRVSNKLIMAAIVERAKVSKVVWETLYGKGGLVHKVNFWQKVSWLFLTILLGQALLLLFK
jgi:hypothetical protein